MIVIRNNVIPFNGFTSVNLFGILFVRNNAVINDVTINHESIHTEQMKEMLYIFFYLWYIIEWIIRLFMKGNAYKNISFEKEAYFYEQTTNYIKFRKKYAWISYLRNK